MSVPPPPVDPRFRKAARVVVLLGDDDGNPPTTSDRCDWLIPVTINRDLGGSTLDSITFRIDLAKCNQRLQDTALPIGLNKLVEVRIENPDTGDLDQLLAWGNVARQPQNIGDGETVGLVARFDHFLFGERFRGYPVREPNSGDIVTIRKPLTFNPVIDGVRHANRSDDTDDNGARLILEPESLRTAAARTLHNATASRWDLSTAVERLCWTLNEDETHFKNPTLADLQAVLGSDTPLLENHTINLDVSLPEALDQLLAPHGYTHFIRHTIDTADADLPRVSTIAVAERGDGDKVTLRLQRLTDTIDSSKTNIETLALSYDPVKRPNVIIGRSKLARREGTFKLRPAWPKTDDTLTKAELTAELKEHDREHIDVFRKFVFDCAGDYFGLRDDFTEYQDLEELFGETTVPMRRRFRPALTQGLDRRPIGVNGYLVEWHNGTEWVTVPWSFSILEHESGILLERGIDEAFRAEFLKKSRAVAAGEVPDPILRITCCLEADFGTTYTAERRDTSANGNDNPRHYDLSHKFDDARVVESGDYASVLFYDRHDSITALLQNVGIGGQLEVAGDLSAILKEGDRCAILDSTDNDDVYHVALVSYSAGFSTISLREPMVSDETVDGVFAYLTEEEAPLAAMTRYCDGIQLAEDFTEITAEATLFGIDHPEYELGQVVTKVEQRNLSLNSYDVSAVEQRHPQISRMAYQLDGQQRINLYLDQFDKVGDRKLQRLRTK